MRDALNNEREIIAIEARRYASHYPQGSDGRNTFVLLAEWIEGRIQTLQPPARESDAEWLLSLADAYQPISNDQSDGEKSERLRRIARGLTDSPATKAKEGKESDQ